MENTLKLLLPLTVTLLLCINPAAGLTCHTCEGASCTALNDPTESCGSGQDRCMTFTIKETSDGQTTVKYKRKCGTKAQCSKDEHRLLSVTSDRGSKLANLTCCKFDHCNKDPPRIPSAPSGGTMKCPKCVSYDDPCSSHIKCGVLDSHCYIYTETPETGEEEYDYGCASANACSDIQLMRELYPFPDSGFSSMVCRPPTDPPIHCEVCLDPCQSCSETTSLTAPPGMRCMSATVEEPGKDPKHLKGMAAAPLCSSNGYQSITLDRANIDLRCCNTSRCNRDTKHLGLIHSVLTCPSDSCPDLLREQLQRLINSIVIVPDTAAITATGQPETPEQHEQENHQHN